MNYVEIGGYSGELFYTFDSFGNTSFLTDSQGNVIVGYLYDLNNGAIKSEYNPQGIDNPYKGGGKDLIINISDFLKISNCAFTYLANKWSDIIVAFSVVPPPKRVTDFKDENCNCLHDKIKGGGDTYGGHPIEDEWKNRYDNLKNANCDELCEERRSWLDTWYYHVGWRIGNVESENYRDYHPFDADTWRKETKDWECPSTCNSNSRFEAGMLQIIDCLLGDCPPCIGFKA